MINDKMIINNLYFAPQDIPNETRNCLVTDILLNLKKSAEDIRKR